VKVKKVKVYSTMMCPYCRMEKSWLEAKEIEHEIAYVDKDQNQAMEMVRKTGQMGVPVTEIEFDKGESKYIVGFDIPGLSEALEVKN
jgi:glutaredoxin